MKTLILYSVGIFLSVNAHAQRVVFSSTTYYGGNGSDDVNRIISTSDGGFLAVGKTLSTDGHFVPPPGGHKYCLVTKHDSIGALQWAKRFGGSSTLEQARCAAQTSDGGFVIGCSSPSNDGDVPPKIGTNPSTSDAWVFKLDASGSLLWSKVYGSSTSDPIQDILPTPDGGLLLLISTGGSDSDAVGGYGGNDWLLIKTDGQGNRQWRRMIGGNDYEGEGRLFNASSGDYFLVGNSLSHDIDLAEDNIWPGGVPPKRGPVFMRLSDSGDVQWCKRYGGSTVTGMESAYIDVSDTSLIAVGYTNSNDFYLTGNHLNAVGNPTYDMFIMKVDRNGELVFSKLLGTHSDDYCNALTKLNDGSYLLNGYLYGPSHFGGEDIQAIHASATGDSLTTFVGGAASHDQLKSIVVSGPRLLGVGHSTNPPFNNAGYTGNGSHPQGNIFVSRIELWPTGISTQANSATSFKLVPNPAKGVVECILLQPATGTLEVIAQTGQVLIRRRFQQQSRLAVDLNGLPAGVYSVIIVDAHSGAKGSTQLAVQ